MNINLLPVHPLNAYIWAMLTDEGVLDAADYSGRIPVIPVQQIPQMNSLPGGPPFLVYGWSEPATGQMWFVNEVTVAWNFYSTSLTTVNKFTNVVKKYFGEMDDSAQAINTWVAENAPQYGEFTYLYTGVTESTSPDPRPDEGERLETLVAVTARYTRQ